MTTQAYYKGILGFDPNDPKEMSSLDPNLHGYEENLSKFKGSAEREKETAGRTGPDCAMSESDAQTSDRTCRRPHLSPREKGARSRAPKARPSL